MREIIKRCFNPLVCNGCHLFTISTKLAVAESRTQEKISAATNLWLVEPATLGRRKDSSIRLDISEN